MIYPTYTISSRLWGGQPCHDLGTTLTEKVHNFIRWPLRALLASCIALSLFFQHGTYRHYSNNIPKHFLNSKAQWSPNFFGYWHNHILLHNILKFHVAHLGLFHSHLILTSNHVLVRRTRRDAGAAVTRESGYSCSSCLGVSTLTCSGPLLIYKNSGDENLLTSWLAPLPDMVEWSMMQLQHSSTLFMTEQRDVSLMILRRSFTSE